MCGICGIIRRDGQAVEAEQIRNMMSVLKHRGPDDEGLYIGNHIGLGHVRLSIIDLSRAGQQPMFSRDKRYCLVFNGEIYNYLEIRESLAHKYLFRSRTDSEVVLNAFIEWGPDCLRKFNGMFAFALLDTYSGELFFARDRFGIKPFYYYLDKSFLAFASEQKALLPLLRRKRPNQTAIYEYLLYNRSDQGDYTFFEGIHKLPHGHCAQWRQEQIHIEKWYDLPSALQEGFQEPGEFYHSFVNSIALQLRSDVPLGVCLSGGLDSSAIVSVLLKEFDQHELNTFSAVYDSGDRENEKPFIDEYRHQLSNMHFVRPSVSDLLEDLDRFILCHSEPVSSLGPYIQFKVMELAGQHVKVTLDGQGADEQLAGYPNFYGIFFKELLLTLHWIRLSKELTAYLRQYRSLYALRFMGLYLAPDRLKDRFSMWWHNYLDPDFFRHQRSESELGQRLYGSQDLHQSLMQHFEYKLEHLLKWEDHNSMAFSVESRVPFLDHNLVEKTLSLPSEKLIHRATSKYFLRQAMTGVLPEKIRTRRDKIGFLPPWDRWFRTERFSQYLHELLHSSRIREWGILNVPRCIQAYENHVSGQKNLAKEIWKWVNLERWLNIYFP